MKRERCVKRRILFVIRQHGLVNEKTLYLFTYTKEGIL
ncbi:hypothetical protein NBRC111894_1988 [Sporolactobacillus inulinus]|uniref:Uncharacterized protein n=1 Tax=Sporolactobacillus inulinus TaxID=2078 RepID=A0A4Y1ZBQ4_9BACL|nr:hypothetical protein NBRC111894_1988 [Sporolactobacillus inulinus]